MNLAQLLEDKINKRAYHSSSFSGSSCDRAIWYNIKESKHHKLDSKDIMIAELNESAEQQLYEDLKFVDSMCGLKTFKDDWLMILEPFIDYVIHVNEVEHLLAIKVLNETCFNSFRKDGLKKWRSEHYEQIQAGMGLTKIYCSVFLALNRNTGALHSENFAFESEFYEDLKAKVNSIINSENPPKRINESKFFYICKECNFRDVCHAR